MFEYNKSSSTAVFALTDNMKFKNAIQNLTENSAKNLTEIMTKISIKNFRFLIDLFDVSDTTKKSTFFINIEIFAVI